jgi:hypothetical protein
MCTHFSITEKKKQADLDRPQLSELPAQQANESTIYHVPFTKSKFGTQSVLNFQTRDKQIEE